MKYLLLIFLVLLSTSLSAVEYGVLSSDGTTTIALSAGDVFEAINWSERGDLGPKNLVYFTIGNFAGAKTRTLVAEERGFSEPRCIVVGPSSIALTDIKNKFHTEWVMFKITRASEVE